MQFPDLPDLVSSYTFPKLFTFFGDTLCLIHVSAEKKTNSYKCYRKDELCEKLTSEKDTQPGTSWECTKVRRVDYMRVT